MASAVCPNVASYICGNCAPDQAHPVSNGNGKGNGHAPESSNEPCGEVLACSDGGEGRVQAGLVIGGGIAGMTAALALAEQGFSVHLVEKSGQLGGTAWQIHRTLDGKDVREHLAETMQRVAMTPAITFYLRTHVAKVEGRVGDFTSTLVSDEGAQQVKHGVIVVATGAVEEKPQSFGYGQDPRVVTQLELSDRIGQDRLNLPPKPAIVMIQCVEQRNTERPYCSRVCCTTAIKNALALKAQRPEARIVVLYREMRIPGACEACQQAREQGVRFVRYQPEMPPELSADGRLSVRFREPLLDQPTEWEPDLVVLAAPMTPRADRQELADLLRVPLSADSSFLDVPMKLHPADFAGRGLFVCGTAHAPKLFDETISQANAVANQAASILPKTQMPAEGVTCGVSVPDGT
jgi:heterodisulfide reductase subunit A